MREQRVEVIDVDEVRRSSVEPGHRRPLTTVVGTVTMDRLAYRHRGVGNLHPADAALNLPTERHSHGVRRLAAVEATRGSFGDAAEAIFRTTGWGVGKRQVEELTARAASTSSTSTLPAPPSLARVTMCWCCRLTARASSCGPTHRDARQRRPRPPPRRRLSRACRKGQNRYHRRTAGVGVVYDLTPVPRAPGDALASNLMHHREHRRPQASG